MFFPSSSDPVRAVESDPSLPLVARTAGYGPSSAADPAEGRRFGGAFWVSAGLHGLAIALLVGVTLAVRNQAEDRPALFEVVAGQGNDFMATDAPSGSEAGRAATGEIEFAAPESVRNWTPPQPSADIAPAEPTPVEPTPVEPVAPVTKAPPVKTPTATATPVPNFKQAVKDKIRQEKRKVDREIKKQRAAEEAAAKAAAEEAKRTSYEQWKKENAAKMAWAKNATAGGATSASPGKRIDAGSIKQGVTGGTGAGSTGAGGTALSRAEANAMEAYFSMLIQRLRDSHEKPGGLSDLLNAEVQFTVAANGAISAVRIVRSSGNAEFDQSVLEAFARVRMPARPDKNTDVQRLTFRIKEA